MKALLMASGGLLLTVAVDKILAGKFRTYKFYLCFYAILLFLAYFAFTSEAHASINTNEAFFRNK